MKKTFKIQDLISEMKKYDFSPKNERSNDVGMLIYDFAAHIDKAAFREGEGWSEKKRRLMDNCGIVQDSY